MEWFYRFLQEPARLWKRYLATNLLFLFYLLGEMLRRGSRAESDQSEPQNEVKDLVSMNPLWDDLSPHYQGNSENAENIKEITV